MKKITVLVEISVADDIADLYPNYNVNYDDENHFIDSLIEGIETPFEYEGAPFDNLKENGYSIRVLTRQETKLLDL